MADLNLSTRNNKRINTRCRIKKKNNGKFINSKKESIILDHRHKTLQSTQKILLPKSAVYNLYYLKLNNIIAQRKTSNLEKQFHP